MRQSLYALITGASSGIGLELTRRMLKEGYQVLGTGRNKKILEQLRGEFADKFQYVSCDLAQQSCLQEIVNRARNDFGRLDVLVNNAGFAYYKPILNHTIEEVEGIFLVNTIRPVQLIISLLDIMPPNSLVVNVVSPAAFVLLKNMTTYTATKAALHILSLELERELASRKIRMLRVYPGATSTSFFERINLNTPWYSLKAETVADKILRCIKKRCRKLYIPWVLGFLELFSPKIRV
ncbi:MAG: SDR family NAD(P)-dependent oxidoreductase [Infirmifilum sp.]|jgi:short-subunit dehydrogenase|uniref:Short-chain dehydrogenase n=1 Tax=Infirmifilum uzonense TaxID=1550241 RepID=A0A0F7FH72_9CREN|nr:SDR family NAD(P)-dependent oxidoreductase [Infirmifilum uzonense]AKG38630.1 hypothetical protein MA03_04095 [Infirmifilum uzonense]